MISRLVLRNFRKHSERVCDFSPKWTVIYGPNGCGKTTILEGISVLTTLKSFRTSRLSDAMKQGCVFAETEAKFKTPLHNRKVEIKSRSKALYRDGQKENDTKTFLQDVSVVCLTPDHVSMVKSGPEERRRYLDTIVFNQDASFFDVSRRYQRALKHKQALLKQKLPKHAYLDLVAPWEAEIIFSGEEIRKKRTQVILEITPHFKSFYDELAKPYFKNLEISYETTGLSIQNEIHKKGDIEHLTERVLTGCQRDDMAITMERKPAKEVASQGETSSILLALKIAELKLIQNVKEHPPTLLLDDIGSTLDEERRNHLFNKIDESGNQVIMTTADPNICVRAKEWGANMVRIEQT